jgi:hypothetical protein
MEKLTELTKEMNLKGRQIDLNDSRHVKVSYKGIYKSEDTREYGLSTHCVDCPRDC